MNAMDDDSPMPDASEIGLRDGQLHATQEIRRSMNGSLILAPPSVISGPAAMLSSEVTHGVNHLRNTAIAGGALNASSTSSFRELNGNSRDSSVFIKNDKYLHGSSTSEGTTTPSEDARSTDLLAEVESRRRLAMLSTGLCYDVRMRYHCELDPPKQRLDFHPEDPRRIFCIFNELCKAGLVIDKDNLTNEDGVQILVPNPLMRVFARFATPAEICLVHDKKHYDFIESTRGWLFTLLAFTNAKQLSDLRSRYD